ncbi:MAG: reverse transcriptase family protein, partial [Candidatus Thiodiazotropha sp.]
MWLKLDKRLLSEDKDSVIGIIYLPPEGSDYSSEDSFNEIEAEVISFLNQYETLFLIGDLNARTGNSEEFVTYNLNRNVSDVLGIDNEVLTFLNEANEIYTNTNIDKTRRSKDKHRNNFGAQLLEMCKNNNLYICNGRIDDDRDGEYTCKGSSVVDYLISTLNGLSLVHKFRINEFSPFISDIHCALTFELPVQTIPIKHEPVNKKHHKWNELKKNDFTQNINVNDVEAIKHILENVNIDTIDKAQINSLMNAISSTLLQSADKTFASTSNVPPNGKRNNRPWFGYRCNTARRHYHYAKKRYANYKSLANKVHLENASREYSATVKSFKAKYAKSMKTKIRQMRTTNPKDYWKLINSVGKKSENPQVKLDDFFAFYKELNTNRHDVNNDEEIQIDDELHGNESILNDPISIEEIRSAIKNLKSNKSGGIDQILNEYIINSQDLLLPVFHKLFNIIFDSAIIPDVWTQGMIIPLYKNKGAKCNPANYRPITLLSCIGKLYTAILNNRLTLFLEDLNIPNETQSGFRKGYSTIDNMIVLHLLIEYLKSKKQKLFCGFIDFAKAFDNVWRIGLWRKLLDAGISGKCFKVIKNLYNGIKSCVFVNGECSGFFPCEVGVRQGENLSPLLFSIYMNDLEQFLSLDGQYGVKILASNNEVNLYLRLYVLLYADDTLILSDNEEEFQIMLNRFDEYCKMWKLTVNVEKSKIVIFGDYSRRANRYSFKINNEVVAITKEYKYLGLLFTRNGRFVQALKHQSSLASKAMHLLRQRIHNLELPIDCQLKLFDQTIVPIILYGCELSGFEICNVLEKVHLDFLRSIFKMKKSTPLVMVYGEFGRFPLSIWIKSRMISYWAKLINAKETKLVTFMYKIHYIMHKSNVYSCKWLLQIKSILDSVGLSYMWLEQKVTSINWLKNTVKSRLKDQYLQSWFSAIDNSPKCINYRLFKSEFKMEEYMLKLCKTNCITLCKYRTTNHRLPIETGRWNNTDRSDRICTLCDNREIGDEFHYLLDCKYF